MITFKQNKRLVATVVIATSPLLFPLVTMNFTNEVNWKIPDFIVATILLCGTGIIYELILRKIKMKRNRIFMVIGLFIALILVWAELAVGIFGTVIAGS